MYSYDEVFAREMLPGEKILWQGKPNPAKIFTKFDIFLVPFSILFGGGSIFAFSTVMTIGAPFIIFDVFGVFFAVVGLYFLFGRFLVKNANKRNTYYLITNMRVISMKITANHVKKSSVSAQINSTPSESASIGGNGIGTITFGVVPIFYAMYLNTGLDFFAGPFQNNSVIFFDIDDCESVFQIYRNVKYQNFAK